MPVVQEPLPSDEDSQCHNNGYTGDRHEQDLMHVLNSCNYSLKEKSIKLKYAEKKRELKKRIL